MLNRIQENLHQFAHLEKLDLPRPDFEDDKITLEFVVTAILYTAMVFAAGYVVGKYV